MGKPYSNDLRERAVAAMAEDRSCREVGVVFGVACISGRTASLPNQWAETGAGSWVTRWFGYRSVWQAPVI
jgi:transposase